MSVIEPVLSPLNLCDVFRGLCQEDPVIESAFMSDSDGHILGFFDATHPQSFNLDDGDLSYLESGLVASLWNRHSQAPAKAAAAQEGMKPMGELNCMIMVHSGSLLGVAASGRDLVCIRSRSDLNLGLMKMKLQHISKALESPMNVALKKS